MRKKINSLLVIMLLLSITELAAANRGFAIVIDTISYNRAKTEVEAYAASIERQGLKTYIVKDVWNNPDSIRLQIKSLAKQKKYPIEGVVFIGDIPVPMIRDAQHFSSAFKAKQDEKKMEFTSIPSDRFYDDFDLDFMFIKTDEKKPNLFYYSLTAQSTQKCNPDIYSARIKTCDKDGKTKYDRLKSYLNKVVSQKQKNETLSQLFYFAGHGYNSDCSLARIDEKSSYYEMFPYMRTQPWAITYQNHANHTFSKYPLMTQMQRKDMSLAILHHHGYPDTEYLNGEPIPQNPDDNISAIKSYIRSKVRKAVAKNNDTISAINEYATKFDIPVHWLDSIFTPASITADSIFEEQLDLHLYDIGKYKPNARVVILDACYNGAFNNESYIAEEYIFEEGDCVVTIANSVNSLQDKWCDRNIGMFALGMRVGNFVKYNPYFESHIFGDPTFTFTPTYNVGFEVNKAINKSNKFWKKQLKSKYPSLQSFAINQLAQNSSITSAELLDIYKTSPNQTVRLMALMTLSTINDDNYINALSLGLNDGYELIRRFSAIQAGKSGDIRLIPALVALASKNMIGDRVDFQLKIALTLFPYDKLITEYKKQDPCKYYYNAPQERNKMEQYFNLYSDNHFKGDVDKLTLPQISKKDKLKIIRSFRNRPLHPAVEQILKAFEQIEDDQLKVALAETMGWFNMSYKRDQIADYFKSVSENNKYHESVRNEALKTYKRLKGI